MATNCIVLQEQEKGNRKKPIVFLQTLSIEGYVKQATSKPSHWENIELIKSGEKDLMFAYNDGSRNSGFLVVGHWNDGVTE